MEKEIPMRFDSTTLMLNLYPNTLIEIAVANLFPQIMDSIKWVAEGNVLDEDSCGYESTGKKINAFLDCMNSLEKSFPIMYNENSDNAWYVVDPTEHVDEETREFHRFVKNHPINSIEDTKTFFKEWLG